MRLRELLFPSKRLSYEIKAEEKGWRAEHDGVSYRNARAAKLFSGLIRIHWVTI